MPVILHLIHRQRYPDRVFTTLRFFDATIKHNVIQKRLIDKLLLLLRDRVTYPFLLPKAPQIKVLVLPKTTPTLLHEEMMPDIYSVLHGLL